MACTEHTCNDCKEGWSDNYINSECPKCGCQDHSTHYVDEHLEDVPEHRAHDYYDRDRGGEF